MTSYKKYHEIWRKIELLEKIYFCVSIVVTFTYSFCRIFLIIIHLSRDSGVIDNSFSWEVYFKANSIVVSPIWTNTE